MRRLLSAVVVAAAAGAFFPAPASADPICVRVQRTGTLPPPLDTGLICVPFVDVPATNCQTRVIDTTSLNQITIYFCLPR